MGNFLKNIKILGIFLAVLLGLFMLVGMYYGVLIFISVLKLMGFAAFIALLIYLHFKIKGKNREDK